MNVTAEQAFGTAPRTVAEPRRPVLRVVLFGAVLALGVYQLGVLDDRGDIHRAALVFVAGWVLCVALLASRGQGGVYSPPAAYVVVFGLFHGGLLLNLVLRGSPGLPDVEISWFRTGLAPVAATLASIGMLSFTLAASWTSSTNAVVRPARPGESRALGILGLGVQFVGIVISFGVILGRGGSGLSGYSAYLDATRGDGLLPYGILAVGIGPVLAIAAGGNVRWVAWFLFAGYAVLAFPLGLRGEVLFPLVAMLMVEVRRGRRMRPLWTAGGAVAVMTLIGIVRQTRAGGLGALFSTSTVGSPMDAVAEMGYSLRPTVVVLGWHSRGEPLRGGNTFLAVPARVLEKVLGQGTPEFDTRLFNVEVLSRVGPIGGSPVAEGYHNFGPAGVIGLMVLLGLLVAVLTRNDRTPTHDAFFGAIFVILLIQVRNAFAPVPVQILLVVALFAGVRLLAREQAGSMHPRGMTRR